MRNLHTMRLSAVRATTHHRHLRRQVHDIMQLTRLKKKKLQLKDQIAKIENQLLPDIIA